MRTSLDTSSPSDVRSVTVVTYSRGSELSIVKGIRTDLPSDAEGRRIQAAAARRRAGASGCPPARRTPARPCSRSRVAACDRRQARVPVAVGSQHDADQVLDLGRAPWPAGSYRSVPCPGLRRPENGWTTTCIRSSQLVPERRLGRARRSPRAGSPAAVADSPPGRRRRGSPCWATRPRARRSTAFPRAGTPRPTPADSAARPPGITSANRSSSSSPIERR